MGWYYPHDASRSQVIDEITADNSKDGRVSRTLRKCFRGNTMYAIHESGPEGETKKWIGVYLLARHGGSWGYKPMDESMGPNECDCPVKYLDECDEPVNEYAREWREAVHARAKQRASRKPKVGETWRLKNGHNYRIIELRPLRGIENGCSYRLPRSWLRERVAKAVAS